MRWDDLLDAVGELPVFSSAMLLAGDVDPRYARMQLSRWVAAGRLHQLRRGLYAIAKPWAKSAPDPFFVGCTIFPGSYVSLQSALSWHGLIPEGVPATTCVGHGRTRQFMTPVGTFTLHRIEPRYRFGYVQEEVRPGQYAFVAYPEKALLDLFYVTPDSDCAEYIRELRLQNFENMRLDRLDELAARFGKPKLSRASRIVRDLASKGKWIAR